MVLAHTANLGFHTPGIRHHGHVTLDSPCVDTGLVAGLLVAAGCRAVARASMTCCMRVAWLIRGGREPWISVGVCVHAAHTRLRMCVCVWMPHIHDCSLGCV